MQASPSKVIEYFNGEKQNIIPLFQRPYTWSRKDWQTLWDDILVQYDLGESSTHFMGAIVSLPARSVPVGVSKFLIIDGQQRLSTISILLCALRDTLTGNNSARIHDVYLTNRYRDEVDLLKLVPTQADRAVYRELVLDRNAGNTDSVMADAYRFFKDQIEHGFDLEGEAVSAETLLATVEHNLQVVMINLDEIDDPYLIFESLNAKGEPLTQADLVRNYVLMRFRHSASSGGEQERIYQQYWRPLETNLGSDITDFLRYDAMKYGENIRKGGIYAAIKARFRDRTSEDIETLLSETATAGEVFLRITHPDSEPNEQLQHSLKRIDALEIRTSYPLLLRLFQSAESDSLSPEDLLACLSLIESFAVRRQVCGVPTNALNKLFLQWCRNYPSLEHLRWLQETMESGNGGRRWPTDAEFASAFQTQPQYGRGATSFVLRSLEESFEHPETVDLTQVTIEHILPQTLTADWEEMMGVQWEADHDLLLHTFGNLTLTGFNSELGNKPFAEKNHY